MLYLLYMNIHLYLYIHIINESMLFVYFLPFVGAILLANIVKWQFLDRE